MFASIKPEPAANDRDEEDEDDKREQHRQVVGADSADRPSKCTAAFP
jgi:hypothetical protein